MTQHGVDAPNRYGDSAKGSWNDLPDGTSIGRRLAADSTGKPALDINIPGENGGYTKVHINPTRGGVPEITAEVRPAPIEAVPPVGGPPKIGEMPILGGPGTPIGPTFVGPPHSLRHPPIIGDPWEEE